MDHDHNNLNLLPGALFSPSKAAQQRAQAQDWHHVESWLASKYQGRSVPQFERNEDTLNAFLALVAANEKADEERDLIWSIQKDALAELNSQAQDETTPSSNAGILTGLNATLTTEGRESLLALSDAATTLDAPTADPQCIAKTLVLATETSQALSQTLLRVSALQRRLENELISLRAQLNELRSPAFATPLNLQRQTLEWTRNTKQLRTKIGEYSERLGTLESTKDNGLIEEVIGREGRVIELRERIEELEGGVEAFKGLPKDKEGYRGEVERVGKELVLLQRKRDRMFEQLVEKD